MSTIIVGVGLLGERLRDHKYNPYITITNEDLKIRAINPTISEMRGIFYDSDIIDTIIGNDRILLIGDLSEKISRAIIPLLVLGAKEYNKVICSIIAMPYSIERNTLYSAKIAFDHINRNSSCVIVIDKDALMVNKELSIDKCNTIIDNSIDTVIELVSNNMIDGKENIMSIVEYNNLRERLSNALSILYNNCEFDKVDDALIYISKNELKLRDLEDVSNYMHDLFASANVNILLNNGNNSLVLLSPTLKFNRYDPLTKLERMDEVYIDNLTRVELPLPQMEL